MGAPSKNFLAFVLSVVALAGAGFAWTARWGGRTGVAIAEAFASGAMIAAALCHMLAEAGEDLEGDKGAEGEEGEEAFPWAQLLCGLGFIFAHCIESVTHALLDKQLHKHGAKHDSDSGATDSIEASEGTSAAEDAVQTMQTSKRHGGAAGPMLMLALSFHSLMEGAALGATSSEAGAVDVFIAILAHKGIAAFMLGVTLMAMRPSSVKYALAMLWFACMTPVGVAIGEQLEGGQLGAAFQAISGGTFLYIGAVESLPNPMGVAQGTFFLGGFGLMAALAKWT